MINVDRMQQAQGSVLRCQRDPRGHNMPTVQLCKYDILLHILAQLVMCQENEVARGQVGSFFGWMWRCQQGLPRVMSCIFMHFHKQEHKQTKSWCQRCHIMALFLRTFRNLIPVANFQNHFETISMHACLLNFKRARILVLSVFRSKSPRGPPQEKRLTQSYSIEEVITRKDPAQGSSNVSALGVGTMPDTMALNI